MNKYHLPDVFLNLSRSVHNHPPERVCVLLLLLMQGPEAPRPTDVVPDKSSAGFRFLLVLLMKTIHGL